MKNIIVLLVVIVLSLTTITILGTNVKEELNSPKVEYTTPTNTNRANNIKPIDRNISRID